MGCSGCATGRGCGTLPAGCKNNGSCGTGGCNKLDVFDWLAGMESPHGQKPFDYVEIRFKNSRKEFYHRNDLDLHVGDIVAVEAQSGHDVGTVSLTGELVRLQMTRKKTTPGSRDIRKVYRKAKVSDVEKWQEVQQVENETMYAARKIAADLKLNMKINDVEYQGDKTKATFYYTAEDRVDFRELIKMLAERFKARIEMRQIGARQEAGRLGGIGSCGRELCCSTWLTDFRSVSTSAARYQQLAINPIKLAGQCGKLKCCLNYELDMYLEVMKDFPDSEIQLKTKKGNAFHQKTDVFKNTMWYAYKSDPGNFIPLPVERVKEIVAMNREKKEPEELKTFVETSMDLKPEKMPDFENVVGQDSLTRFDNRKKRKKKRRNKKN